MSDKDSIWEKIDKKLKYMSPLFIFLLILYLYDSFIGSVVDSQTKSRLMIVILSYFIFELFVKYIISDDFGEFIKKYWFDIVLVIPFFKSLRLVGRLGKLLKILKYIPYAQKLVKVPKMIVNYISRNNKSKNE